MKALLLGIILSVPLLAQGQVITGQLYWAPANGREGDSPAKEQITYKDRPVEIIVFEPLTVEDAAIEDGRISRVLGKEVTRTWCKWDGSFRVRVSPGRYSVLAYRDGAYFGNLTDSEGHLSPVTVLPRRRGWITITLPYPHAD